MLCEMNEAKKNELESEVATTQIGSSKIYCITRFMCNWSSHQKDTSSQGEKVELVANWAYYRKT